MVKVKMGDVSKQSAGFNFDYDKAVREHSNHINRLTDSHAKQIAQALKNDGMFDDKQAKHFALLMQRELLDAIVRSMRVLAR